MDIGVRAKQEARAELATWQECYRDVAYTEAGDLIPLGRWSQHCLEIAALTLAKTVFSLSKCHSELSLKYFRVNSVTSILTCYQSHN
jgi:hypothetical protein